MIGVIIVIAASMFSAAQSSYLGPRTLPLREGTAEIHGRVLDALSQKPVADLEVQVIEVDTGGVLGPGALPRHAVTHTDAAGRFAVTKIGASSYIVRVTGKTHLPICFGGSWGSLNDANESTSTMIELSVRSSSSLGLRRSSGAASSITTVDQCPKPA